MANLGNLVEVAIILVCLNISFGKIVYAEGLRWML